ncbi:MAG: hypothetical protein NZ874_02810 [Fimbriimonadales bacterium]|nr:hypothetical protein [Fimbriimonadales bacterium]
MPRRDCIRTRTGFRSVGVSPTPLRGTGILPVQRSTDSRVRASGLGHDGPSHALLGRDAQATQRGIGILPVPHEATARAPSYCPHFASFRAT